jgi:hypothetical protein
MFVRRQQKEPPMTEPIKARRRLAPFSEAMKYIGVGRTRCHQLINSGQVTAVKLGAKTLVDLDSVDRFHSTLPRIGAEA